MCQFDNCDQYGEFICNICEQSYCSNHAIRHKIYHLNLPVCCYTECNESGIYKCGKCDELFCDYHYNNHKHKCKYNKCLIRYTCDECKLYDYMMTYLASNLDNSRDNHPLFEVVKQTEKL